MSDQPGAEVAPRKVSASELALQTGWRSRPVVKQAIEWTPNCLLGFVNRAAAEELKTMVKPDGGIHLSHNIDPAPMMPWLEGELQTFEHFCTLGAEKLLAGEKVWFLCMGGKNRSRAAAIAACTLAGMDTTEMEKPEDDRFMELISCVTEKRNVTELAPFPKRTKRKR
jgi:hypothetical protein